MPPATQQGAVAVQGLDELVRAFRVASKAVASDVQEAIKQSGEPIRQDAENRVRSNLSRMSRGKAVPRWYAIRLGIEKQTIGYIVPATKATFAPRRRYARPKVAARIAAEENAARDAQSHRIQEEFDDALKEVARAWARV